MKSRTPGGPQKSCGFENLKKDEDGYYCAVCGHRMIPKFREVVRATLAPKFLAQLDEQCQTA